MCMKKIISLFGMAVFGITAGITAGIAALSAADSDVFIGEWQGSAGEYDINIMFMYSNMCVITVKSVQDGREVSEETNGTWSCDDNIIRINGSFPNAKIRGLSRINWTSVYSFNNNDKSAFSLLVTPPGGSRLTRVSFERIMRWIDV